jgi:hypothetical protein
VLALTVAWKLTVRADATDYLEGDLEAFLHRQSFAVTQADFAMDGMPVLIARGGDCRMQVMKASYYGADRDMIRALETDGDRALFLYRGRVYAEQPVTFIVADQILMRLLRRLGLVAHEPPVLAVVASPSCAADALPWSRL